MIRLSDLRAVRDSPLDAWHDAPNGSIELARFRDGRSRCFLRDFTLKF